MSGIAAACLAVPGAALASAPDPVALVNPFMGTQSGAPDFGTGGGAGNTYPGATLPFGLVQFSPDTLPGVDNQGGGYSYEDHRLRGFSLDHISGAGCAAESDFPVIAVPGRVTASPAVAGSADLEPRFEPRFAHRAEIAAPGNYRVTLNPGARAVQASLTATTRTGDARFVFPRGGGTVLINAGGSTMGDVAARVSVDPARREITGSAESGYFCYQPARYRVYFAARFSRPFAVSGAWQGTRLLAGGRTAGEQTTPGLGPPVDKPIVGGPPLPPGAPSSGVQAGAYAGFAAGRPVEVSIGLSYVSVAGARANLRAEAQGHSFAAMSRRATLTWRSWLDRVQVGGGSRAERRLFYTQLYHALLMPNTFSDATGAYAGMDGRVHHTRGTEYANFSGWDVYRSQIPLLAMLTPGRASEMAKTLLDEGRQSSGQLPKWPLLDTENNIMVGDPADLMLSGAWAFGARGFSGRAALAAMVHGATVPGRSANNTYVERAGLADYLRLGYVPAQDNVNVDTQTYVHDGAWGAVSTTLEYALADFSIARLAHGLGQPGICRRFAPRGANWRHVLDPSTGDVRLRSASGAWVTPFSATSDQGFAEGNAAQYTWSVPQDVSGLIASLHGAAAVRHRLTAFLSRLNVGFGQPYAFLGNEPSLEVPYLFDWLGRPAAGSAVLRRALLGLYGPGPTGAPGNDDGGEMASWWVLSALGLYPGVPGTDVLALSAPLFARATVHLPGGPLRIVAPGAATGAPAIAALRLDGRSWPRTWVAFTRLVHGGELRYTLAGRPQRWGTASAARPPSFSPAATCRS